MFLKKTLVSVMIISAVMLTGCEFLREIKHRNDGNENSSSHSGPAIFFDDFNDGLDPAWFIRSGTYDTNYGYLTSGGVELYVRTKDSPSWTNYRVEADLSSLGNVKFHFRTSADFKRSLVINFFFGGISWWQNGDERQGQFDDGSENLPVSLRNGAHIIVDAIGNKYTIYVKQNDQGELVKMGTITNDAYTVGMPGLSFCCGSRVDNFQVSDK
ncbi:hypothetical protein HY229_02745 [Candidatus Acetothermia bacterium]|nr:hypothetical protein [Candidatus Acetothermia bacterium]MBI3643000.1 hypothetical protein [Candidatus Acetothermia bacterium]